MPRTESNNCLYQEILLLGQTRYSNSSSSARLISANTIYEVPKNLKDVNPKAYLPRVVSIGLIHHSATELMMNMHKESYVRRLFMRTVQSEETTEYDYEETVARCVNVMLNKAESARNCYPEKFIKSEEFDRESNGTARRMLVDGCFILELLLIWSIIIKNKTKETYDPIISNSFVLNNVVHDLLMLENQIPFFVLEELYLHTVKQIKDRPSELTVKELILQFFGNKMNPNIKLKINNRSSDHHILGFLHSCYQPLESDPGYYLISKYCATELHRSGVNFKPSKDGAKIMKPSKENEDIYLRVDLKLPCLFAWTHSITRCCQFLCLHTVDELPLSMHEMEPVKEHNVPKHTPRTRCCWFSYFCQMCYGATLVVPQICITDLTEPFLRNLIAFEQCSQKIPRYITSYAFLMDTLINSKEHVELLETSGVLKNYLGSGEDASNLFNGLCKDVVLGDFYFSSQWEQVDGYYRRYWPSCMASLRRTYFSNPWTGISICAALILFVFTAIQTVCTLIPLLQ